MKVIGVHIEVNAETNKWRKQLAAGDMMLYVTNIVISYLTSIIILYKLHYSKTAKKKNKKKNCKSPMF